MFEGIITSLLNKVLGDFIEGIKADQLSISLLSGNVEFINLSIKPNILDKMPLPFQIKYEKVGKKFENVPVTSLLSFYLFYFSLIFSVLITINKT